MSFKTNYKELRQWYNKYVRQFLSGTEGDENILLKYYHSLRVSAEMGHLARSLGHSPEATDFARLIGLFHDIGRFTQYRNYHTFNDSKSKYHGQLGLKVLSEEKILDVFTEEDQDIINTSIYNHGIAGIPENTSGKTLLYSKMIRDADKLDIYRIITNYYLQSKKRNVELEMGLEDKPQVSYFVFENFARGHMILKSELRYVNDFKLLQIAWIYDMNFDYTRRKVRQQQYLESLINTISDDTYKSKIYKICSNFLKPENVKDTIDYASL